MRQKIPKIIQVDGNTLPFVSVHAIMGEALRLSKARKATIELKYNGVKLTILKDWTGTIDDLVRLYYKP